MARVSCPPCLTNIIIDNSKYYCIFSSWLLVVEKNLRLRHLQQGEDEKLKQMNSVRRDWLLKGKGYRGIATTKHPDKGKQGCMQLEKAILPEGRMKHLSTVNIVYQINSERNPQHTLLKMT